MVSEVHRDVLEIHRNMKNQNAADDQRGPVSHICVLFDCRMNKQLLLFRLELVPLLPIDPASYNLRLAYPENARLPH